MRNPWKSVLGLWVIGMGLGVSASAQAASGVGPYYAMPAWDQKLACTTTANCPRFIVLTDWFSEAAVLDRETGLVWERVPSNAFFDWDGARGRCNTLRKGGRLGWRLPTIQDLASLIDDGRTDPSLPDGHPFTALGTYWSASTSASDTTDAWIVTFTGGFVNTFSKSAAVVRPWCVRGGVGVDPQ